MSSIIRPGRWGIYIDLVLLLYSNFRFRLKSLIGLAFKRNDSSGVRAHARVNVNTAQCLLSLTGGNLSQLEAYGSRPGKMSES